MRKKGKFTGDIDVTFTNEEVQLFEQKIAESDGEDGAARVNFRWDKGHVDVIKAAADVIGVPYQTYIKMVIFEHATTVLNRKTSIGMHSPNTSS